MAPNQKTKLQQTSSILDKKDPNFTLNLLQAANTFVKHVDGEVQLWAASRDWFLEEWGRDTFISLPGLLLYTERFGEAKEVFRRFARFEKRGLIPNRIREHEVLYNTVDGSMWFIQALDEYVTLSGDESFLHEMLPTVRNIIEGYKNGTSYDLDGREEPIYMDLDGLIISPKQATWMDANPDRLNPDAAITPRNGKAVEINALWYANLLIVGGWELEGKRKKESQELLDLAKRVKKSFVQKMWNKSESCLLDVIEGDAHAGALRSNQIFAVSHGRDLLPKTKQKQVLDSVTNDLLTVGGLRTLSARDSNYCREYDTYLPMREKDKAYHQGTIWPWLIGPYIDGFMKVGRQQKKSEENLKREARKIISPLVDFAWESEFKSLPEVFSAESPYDPGGTTSQAWSVSEVLRVGLKYRLF